VAPLKQQMVTASLARLEGGNMTELNKTIQDLKMEVETMKKTQRETTLEIETLEKKSGTIDVSIATEYKRWKRQPQVQKIP
jgi:predicted  nucleic acid-binding Zn-ribbon protein